MIGAPVGPNAQPVEGRTRLDARQLDAATLRDQFLGEWRDTIAEIVDRGTYLDKDDVDGLVDAALPGGDEIFALLALADLLADAMSPYARIVIDTAPTGHTLRLLALPNTFSALVSMLDLMQGKHRFMVRALTHRYRRDRADQFLDEMRRRVDALRSAISDEKTFAAVLVTRDEPVVEAESLRYIQHLRTLHVRIAAIIVNAARRADYSLDPSIPHAMIPFVERARSAPSAERISEKPFPSLRTLTIVGGKGGVGKSTTATALAIAAADEGRGNVLLVSTDPAPSIADALGETGAPWTLADAEYGPPSVPGLVVRQMDATAAFARIRDQYEEKIDGLFTALISRGIDVQQDRAILRDLLALAPPGIDELFALSLLGDALAEQRFSRIVVDPAPTGHLLRLIDMPSIALDWTHRLMRMMLKYREVVGLGDTAQELLDFAKRTRALEALLRAPAQAGLVIVSLDEPVVRSETARLVAAMQTRGLDLLALICNRVEHAPSPLPTGGGYRQFFAEETRPAPVGAEALRAWYRTWRSVQ